MRGNEWSEVSETFDAYGLDEQGPAVLRRLSGERLPDLAGQIPAGQVRSRVIIEIGR